MTINVYKLYDDLNNPNICKSKIEMKKIFALRDVKQNRCD